MTSAAHEPAHGRAQVGAPGWRFTHDAMACTFGARLIAEDRQYAERAAWAAFDEVDRLEQLLNRFISHSDIARINRLRPGEYTKVASETVECLQLAAAVYDDTHGAFDVAFRWRRAASLAPAREEVSTPLVFDPVDRAVGVLADGVELDLGGIGKGFAVDRMAAVLREWRITAALLDSGQSTAYALGRPSAASAWRVALRTPDEQQQPLGLVELRDGALSGSGQRLHDAHIRDPRTGAPAERWPAAWALAPTAALSDALSTAFMVLGADEINECCQRRRNVGGIVSSQTGAGWGLSCYGACPAITDAGSVVN